MSETCDVVVVGGGILGCSTACELKQAGAGDVLVLDRDGVAQATSNAGGGFVTLWGAFGAPHWGVHEIALERYGLEIYRSLAEQGHDIGYKKNGTLFPAASEDTWKWLSAVPEAGLIETEVLDGRQIAEATGITVAEEVVGGVFTPDGCQVNAGPATAAMAANFARSGGRIQTRRPVTAIRTSGSRAIGVDTPWGPIDAGAVVVAAGAWTNQLLAGIGSWLPMVPLTASRITTAPLGVAPMPSMLWADFSGLWIREEAGGLVFGAQYSAEPHFRFTGGSVPDRFDQLPLDGFAEVQRFVRAASRVMPILGSDMSMTLAHGVPCYTPDKVGLVGAMPGADGLWVAAGCNEGGVTHGPGYGRVIADLLTEGTTTVTDADRLRVDRFGERFDSLSAVTAELIAMQRAAREALTKHMRTEET